MDFRCVIAIALEMPLYNLSDSRRIHIRARKRALVEQYLADVIRKLIAIPDSEVKDLVTTEPDTLQMKWPKHVVHLGNPLRHARVVGVFGLE